MENTNDLYIGRKSRPHTCPVCMRTKEDAIAEQLQTGKSCGHERCEFKSEIELVSSILKAPNPEQLKTITAESIETSKKTHDLLLILRESVREMKEGFRNQTEKDDAVTDNEGSSSEEFDESRNIEVSQEQLQSILARIDNSTRTMSKLIEKMDGTERPIFVTKVPLINEVEKPSYENDKQWKTAIEKLENAVKGMRETLEEMKNESEPNKYPTI